MISSRYAVGSNQPFLHMWTTRAENSISMTISWLLFTLKNCNCNCWQNFPVKKSVRKFGINFCRFKFQPKTKNIYMVTSYPWWLLNFFLSDANKRFGLLSHLAIVFCYVILFYSGVIIFCIIWEKQVWSTTISFRQTASNTLFLFVNFSSQWHFCILSPFVYSYFAKISVRIFL